MTDGARVRVLWFGAPSTAQVEEEFRVRGLSLELWEIMEPLPSLAPVTAVVFSFTEENVDGLAQIARRHIHSCVDYGVRVDLVASDDDTFGRVQAILGKLTELAGVHGRTAPAHFEIAEKAARHGPGPRPRLDLDIQVAGNREPIRASDRPLFERAFGRCKKIVLSELTGGRSGARVFSVHATVDTSLAGVWPQPFFAKLDQRDKIVAEAQNYEEYAARFIPFGLRPNIQDMILGHEYGLLVGDFVDRSESLWDLARRNVAAHAISALVDETLVGWRNQAYAADSQEGSVAVALENAGILSFENIKPRYPEHAKQRGGILQPEEIKIQLMSLRQRFRVAPIHGDLHGENVRVRNGQAILIDLASVAKGPLTADLAALETWLAFELPPEEESRKGQYENAPWRSVIEQLYAPESFQHPPAPADPTDEYCWMTSVVRQIRHMGIAVQSCPTEYQTAVAVQLLRRCQWDDGCTADRFRRTHGYVVAAQLSADLYTRSVQH